jgi:hypothetical protein
LTSISDEKTKLRLFSQCIIQKKTHILSSDILYHLPTDNPDPPREEWNGPLTNATDSTIKSFLIDLLQLTKTPDYAILISQIDLSKGGLGLLCPRTCAAPNFVLSMITAFQNATQGI